MMKELLGREGGCCGGKGGSMHLTSVEHGMMGSYAIIGAHLTIANGAAWGAQLRGTEQVAVAFFGDGTTLVDTYSGTEAVVKNGRVALDTPFDTALLEAKE